MALITAADARQQIPGLSGTGEDALLDTLIGTADAAIAAYLGFPTDIFGQLTAEVTTYTFYMDSIGGRDLNQPVSPIVTIASIYDDPSGDFEAETLVSASDYSIDNRRGTVRLKSTAAHGGWSRGFGTIKLTCDGGYVTAPKWLKQALQFAVRHLYDLRQTQGKTNQSGGNVSIGLVDPAALPQEARDLLDAHRLPASVIG